MEYFCDNLYDKNSKDFLTKLKDDFIDISK